MKNYFIIHGINRSGYEHWLPWLYSKLTMAGEKCTVPHFPLDGDYKQWKKVLEGYVDAGQIDADTIFVCHSIGAVFISRFIVEHKLRVSGIIAVAPFNCEGNGAEELKKLIVPFLTKARVMAKVKNYVKFYHCIYSDNDERIPYEESMNYAKAVGAKVHEIEGAGHFTSQDGYSEFPFLWELLDKINTIV